MRHDKKVIEKIINLRKQGYSIPKIMAELSLSKTTVWHHVQKVTLSEDQKKQIRSNQGGSKLIRLANVKKADLKAKEILQGPGREYLIIIAMLYWAEGHKKNCCDFINSDGIMIKVFLKILREVLKIEEEKIHITIRLFDEMDISASFKYWEEMTNISKSKFKLRINDGGTKGRTPYGMCRVTIRRGHETLKLMHSLINSVSSEILNQSTLPS